MRPGTMLFEVICSIFKKPATNLYPAEPLDMAKNYRGKLKFHPDKCIGCQMCVRDCPAKAINIKTVGEKKFACEINLGKCIYCAQCVDSCPKKALESTVEVELAQLDSEKLKVVFNATDPEKPKELA